MKFAEYFTEGYLKEVYFDRVLKSPSKGIDKIDHDKFSDKLDEHLEIIVRKVTGGEYSFSPYVELLKLKGAGKSPRVISIPTIRDRLVLSALKNYLHDCFYSCVPEMLPNNYVKNLFETLKSRMSVIYRTDIKNFYSSIDHTILLNKIKDRVRPKRARNLIRDAIQTPTVKATSRKKSRPQRNILGVPEGLSISNILASIYLQDVDCELNATNCSYWRYVDDILILSKMLSIKELTKLVSNKMYELGLELNQDKTILCHKKNEFVFLGYKFQYPKLSINDKSFDNYINSIASFFKRYEYNKRVSLNKYSHNLETIKKIFIEDLNEKITGALFENRRYGWILYYNEINDLELLFRIDNIIDKFFKKMEDFDHKKPKEVKRIVIAYYKSKYDCHDGYIHNYEHYDTGQKKLEYLLARCHVTKEEGKLISEKAINALFSKVRQKNLSRLEMDIGLIS